MEDNKIVVYTDGSCFGNPGPGGWAAVINENDDIHIVKNYCIKSTNNRMELLAVINALKYLKDKGLNKKEIVLYSDSNYVVSAINKKWIEGWILNGWKNAKGYAVKNKDLWLQLNEVRKEFYDFSIDWVKGHNDNPMNDTADKEAKSMASFALERTGNIQ